MKKGEIWISSFWEGEYGVLIGNKTQYNVWNCTYLRKLEENKYYIDKGGRMTGNPMDTMVYSGEGMIIEDVFSQFYHLGEGIEIVPMPDISPSDVLISGTGTL